MQQITSQRQAVVPAPGEGMDLPPTVGAEMEGDQLAVMLPPGLTEDYFITKGAFLNQKFDEYFQPKLLNNIKDTLRILAGGTPAGSLPNGTQLPLPQSILHTAMSRLTQAINARPKHVEAVPDLTPLLPLPSSDDQQCYESWVNQAMMLIPNFDDRFSVALQNALQESVGCMELMWSQTTEEAQQLMTDPETGQPGGMQPISRQKGNVDLEPASLFELAWDPREKESFSRASWVRRRRMVSANELLRLEAEGMIQNAQHAIDTAAKTNNNNTALQTGSKDPDAERVRAVSNQNLPVLNFEDGIYQLDRFYATVSWKNTETELWETKDFNYWVVGATVLVRLRESWMKNGRKPFLTLPLLKGGEGLVGISIFDLIKDALRDLSTTSSRNNRVMTRVAETPTFYGVGSGLNAKSKVMQENALVPVFDVDQVKLGPIPIEILNAMQQHMEFLIDQIRTGTPANDQSQGVADTGVDTATEAQILSAGSSSRFDWMANVCCTGFFPELASMVQEANALFALPEDLIYRSAGMEGDAQPLPMQFLMRPWRYIATPPVEEAYKLRRFNQIKDIVTQLTQVQMTAPQLFMQPDGSKLEVDFLKVLNEQLLPLAGMESKSIFRKVAPPPPPQMGMPPDPNAPPAGMPPPGPGAGPMPPPSQGLPPMPSPPGEPTPAPNLLGPGAPPMPPALGPQ